MIGQIQKFIDERTSCDDQFDSYMNDIGDCTPIIAFEPNREIYERDSNFVAWSDDYVYFLTWRPNWGDPVCEIDSVPRHPTNLKGEIQ